MYFISGQRQVKKIKKKKKIHRLTETNYFVEIKTLQFKHFSAPSTKQIRQLNNNLSIVDYLYQ